MRYALTAILTALLAGSVAHAAKTTVCTVTVNSPDERDAFRAALPAGQYDFVELVEHGRPDWLASSCHRKIACDVLIVSGHFAGTEFYSSKPQVNETLPVDEIERVACSNTCPDLFANLKEVYLFGCDTLKKDPVRSATPEIIRGLVKSGVPKPEAERFAQSLSERYSENARDRMRRVFPRVPVIYGFSSLAQDPGSTANRDVVVSRGQALTQAFADLAAQFSSARARWNPAIDLPDPCPWPLFNATMMAGRWKRFK